MKKAISFVLCVAMLILPVMPAFASETQTTDTGHDYSIENPYKDVVWQGDNAWHLYKADLHCHTDASDATPSISECIEKHYELGYDILAITDHAVIGAEWTEVPDMVPLYRLFKASNTHMEDPVVLTQERYEQITTGADRDGKPMLEVTGALEANGATPINDCHVNAFFADYGQALMGCYGDYETVVKRVDKQGGITFLDHTGEYVGCEDDPDRAREPYYANKFANIFLNYDSCVAFDVNSGVNNRTRYDCILWDEILKLTIPNGRNVSCISFTDGHHLDQYDRAFSYMCMPELTVDALRTSLESGAFFAVGRYARADLGEDFVGEGDVPLVTNLVVNQDTDTISFEAKNYDNIKWYSDGNLIAEGGDVTALDLDDYEGKLGCYVRFTLTGPGGICYSQAFPITAPDIVIEKPVVYPTYDIGTVFRGLADMANILLGWTPVFILIRGLLWGRVWWLY